ncbi:uncharacterized protein LOC112199594 [Rosa chinensis]|uniref:uncharacterized protein LOC112199594 n=1 Tax=Rosa chinensis TaxID=74649 RepID=UPI000D08D53E|nr:uncharacterized protein LOC112199594 [Rosa chinensis]
MPGGEDSKPGKGSSESGSARTPEAWENPNHPLYLHHSDQPGAILVSQSLEENNYMAWIQSMSMALTIKNKKGFVDGSIPRPTNRVEEALQWQRCDTLVKTWLLGSMSKEISGSFFNIENAIHDTEQGNGTVTSYFTKLKSLWDERDAICEIPASSCEAAQEIKAYMENQKTMKFLMGLNESYAAI